ncbi:MAG: class A beta-lactamase-related serine hydrolase [Chloroflexota bacterium]|nr:class A beta-lactamase-related serine hydrolase [Chloroflexota bacterium]
MGAGHVPALESPGALASLGTRLNALCDAHAFHTGWYLKDLQTGAEADRHGDVVVPSASTRKISILMAVLKWVREGRLSLEQPVTIEARYQTSSSGCFQHFRSGFIITLHDALVMMIVVSDNACTGTIADMVGLDTFNDYCRAVGMRGTTHRYGIPSSRDPHVNETTPKDVGLLLDFILLGSTDPSAAAGLGVTPELCRLAVDILSWQQLNTRIPLLLPAGTRVAHKTGTGGDRFNDAGIVYRGDAPRFILTVYTSRVPRELPDGTSAPGATSLLIGRMARACWDALP